MHTNINGAPSASGNFTTWRSSNGEFVAERGTRTRRQMVETFTWSAHVNGQCVESWPSADKLLRTPAVARQMVQRLQGTDKTIDVGGELTQHVRNASCLISRLEFYLVDQYRERASECKTTLREQAASARLASLRCHTRKRMRKRYFLHVALLEVRPDHRRRGFARALLSSVLRAFDMLDARLCVEPKREVGQRRLHRVHHAPATSEQLVRFYGSVGFRRTELRPCGQGHLQMVRRGKRRNPNSVL
jgi:GNAT superfamily N-acetyltransferase